MAAHNRGARVYISVTAPDGDEINFHRTFRSDDGVWTGSKRMLSDAIDTLLGPAVIAEDNDRERGDF